jgi:hypothetical protein
MAANPIAVVHDGMVEIPNELKDDPRFRNGASLRLVPVIEAPVAIKGDWRRLEGILADSDFDPNSELEAEKQRELESEAHWLRR